MKNQYGVDLDIVRANAASEGIPLSEITLFYTGLTKGELDGLLSSSLATHQTSEVVIAKFLPSGEALYPDKVSGVYTLST